MAAPLSGAGAATAPPHLPLVAEVVGARAAPARIAADRCGNLVVGVAAGTAAEWVICAGSRLAEVKMIC
jgi:hypothetical protein